MSVDESVAMSSGDLPRAADEAARAGIVAAVAPLFYARGFTTVGMDEVRTVSGVSLKRLYRLFPSKEDLIEQVLRGWRDAWEANLTARVESTQVPRERLLAVFDLLAAWFTSEGFRGCAFINSFGELGGTSGRIGAIVRGQKAGFQDYLAHVAAGAGAPATLAPQLAILAEGAVTTAAISASPEPARQARAAAETLIDTALGSCPRCRKHDEAGNEEPVVARQ
ncbi:TetR/AcrR family transcriptional regulator [Arthrobacter bambusae]|uniref:TetR/AcrR family transcriptional regulator n=1 Tax=Arthrobacter bambusae TaxID=1338426 RepID=UPI0027895ECF|nr:TetR/AcrR family transcriptional regulator [Arthrobacter bambusae]MDQ0213570.1 AcrR family transcriptional regulator [Arthrobacter bambusae]MDQ0237911.1 AcrR family transcriptional regulator [Arthrobacter bambusae]